MLLTVFLISTLVSLNSTLVRLTSTLVRLTSTLVSLIPLWLEDFKLEKGPTDKAVEPDPGGSDQQNLGFKKLKNRKTDRTVGLNFCISNISSGTA